jgi:hypothetical protein
MSLNHGKFRENNSLGYVLKHPSQRATGVASSSCRSVQIVVSCLLEIVVSCLLDVCHDGSTFFWQAESLRTVVPAITGEGPERHR